MTCRFDGHDIIASHINPHGITTTPHQPRPAILYYLLDAGKEKSQACNAACATLVLRQGISPSLSDLAELCRGGMYSMVLIMSLPSRCHRLHAF